ncbi:unnamed protein product [Candida verbasci]|uniref:SPT2-like protein n=1 Tax=Candida verbasci TaxID=1227364 RepID=A0A9W4TXG4_9ASCO|nr:unnamed protein product [Candida verbasci]
MSFESILRNIDERARIESNNVPTDTLKTNESKPSEKSKPYIGYAKNKPVDPKVAELKRKRQEEKLKKLNDERAKKGLKPVTSLDQANNKSKATSKSNLSKARKEIKSTIPIGQFNPKQQQQQQQQQPKKKMSFNELMKKASTIDNSKLKVSIPHKSHTPEAKHKLTDKKPKSASPVKSTDKKAKSLSPTAKKDHPKPAIAQPLPIRQPGAKVQELLKKKKKLPHKGATSYDDEDEYDSFVEEDEEVFQEDGYNKEEIWAIFNKGKKRTQFHDDYDSDDMEATGGDIFDEELKSRRIAQLEDQKEMENEKRLAELKRQRKKQRV